VALRARTTTADVRLLFILKNSTRETMTIGNISGVSRFTEATVQSGAFYHASGDLYNHAFLIDQADKAPEALIAAGKGSPYRRGATTRRRPTAHPHSAFAGFCLRGP